MNLFQKIKDSTFFKKSNVCLGKGTVTQYILIENKHFFSIIFYKWNTISQSRFHSHAFNAVAFLIKGFYWEKIIFDESCTEVDNVINVPLVPRFLPKNYIHSIGYSKPNTITMLISGKWDENWHEYFPDSKKWVRYGWGRVVIDKSSEFPNFEVE